MGRKKKKFVKYFVIIGVILAAAFFSSRADLLGGENSFTFVNDAASKAEAYIADGYKWALDKAFPNISGEVQKRGEMIVEGANQEKEKISESLLEKTKNYFSGIVGSIFHPGSSQNCPE